MQGFLLAILFLSVIIPIGMSDAFAELTVIESASKAEVEHALAEENAEWKGVHWSERNYTAKLGE